MFQEFFKDTLISRFIKRLLRATNIPLLHTIHRDSEIIEGCLYLYENYVIKCVQSGRFYVDPEEALYPGDQIYPSLFLYPSKYLQADASGNRLPQGSYVLGKYQVVKYYDENDMQIHYNYHSKFMYYDSDTHQHLGEYLRYLKDRKNLNLMPYYNCFNNKLINRAYIRARKNPNDRTFENRGTNEYKLLAIPVKFGQTYTIAIDSNTPIQLRSMIYNDDAGCVVKDIDKPTDQYEYYSDDIDDYEFISSTNFIKPFIKTIPPARTQDLYAQEKNLYLIIQVAPENESAVTVLEGDYINSWTKITSNAEYYTQQFNYYKNISLLHFNSHKSYAFSDRLIEYLLLNVIDLTDTLDGNIKYVQELVENNIETFKYPYKGIWNDKIRLGLSEIEDEKLKTIFIRDLDGYLNKDIDAILTKGG